MVTKSVTAIGYFLLTAAAYAGKKRPSIRGISDEKVDLGRGGGIRVCGGLDVLGLRLEEGRKCQDDLAGRGRQAEGSGQERRSGGEVRQARRDAPRTRGTRVRRRLLQPGARARSEQLQSQLLQDLDGPRDEAQGLLPESREARQ